MNTSPTIKELTPGQLAEAYPIVRQLRPHLTAAQFTETAAQMMSDGYRVICLYSGEEILAYAGFAELLNLYYGKHIWIYELVTDEKNRGKGYGAILLSHIEELAKENNLNCVALSSGMERTAAHKFYEEKNAYKKSSFVFRKNTH